MYQITLRNSPTCGAIGARRSQVRENDRCFKWADKLRIQVKRSDGWVYLLSPVAAFRPTLRLLIGPRCVRLNPDISSVQPGCVTCQAMAPLSLTVAPASRTSCTRTQTPHFQNGRRHHCANTRASRTSATSTHLENGRTTSQEAKAGRRGERRARPRQYQVMTVKPMMLHLPC